MSLMRNSLLQNIADSSIIRVLYMVPTANSAIVISLDKKDTLPYEIVLSELECDSEHGDYIEIQDEISKIDFELTDKQEKALNDSWDLIKCFVLNEPDCYNKKIRSTFVKNTAISNNIHRYQVQRLLYKYWSKGMTKYALIADYKARGRKSGEVNVKSKSLGRPVKNSNSNQRLIITSKELNHIKHIINKHYNTDENKTLQFAYEQLINNYYFNKELNKIVDSYPIFGQFKYHSKKFIDEKKRVGVKKYERTRRELLGSSRSEAAGPGEMYQIDATIADIYLVSNIDRNQLIGRPVLYFVTDVFSRMIVGFYVGLEAASYISLMMALYYTFSNKVDICKLYGIDIKEEEWPCAGLPLQITNR